MSKKNNKDEKKKKNPFDMKDFSAIFREMFERFQNNKGFGIQLNNDDNLKLNPSDVENYSISFKIDENMEEPEINVNGEPIDEESLRNLLKDLLPEGFNFNLDQLRNYSDITNLPKFLQDGMGRNSIATIDASTLKLPEEDTAPSIEIQDTYGEISYEDDSTAEITIELPGVDKSEIDINYFDDIVMISAESETAMYNKEFELKFSADKNKSEISGKNGIFQIIFKK